MLMLNVLIENLQIRLVTVHVNYTGHKVGINIMGNSHNCKEITLLHFVDIFDFDEAHLNKKQCMVLLLM